MITGVELYGGGVNSFEYAIKRYNILDIVIADKMRKQYAEWTTSYLDERNRIMKLEDDNMTSIKDLPTKIKNLITKNYTFNTLSLLKQSEYRTLLNVYKIRGKWYYFKKNVDFIKIDDLLNKFYIFLNPVLFNKLIMDLMPK